MSEKIRVHLEAETPLFTVEQLLRDKGSSEEHIRSLSDDALAAGMRFFEMGTESSPQLFESQVPPNTVAPVHSHEEDEIIYVLEGEMQFGTKSLSKGSALFVQANARYGFKAGPEGVRFLNFRPRRCDF
jgi:quercetin dioxygenase-like cupin family protein